jgi:glycosyltransferase involved in cell wall biosynthesis
MRIVIDIQASQSVKNGETQIGRSCLALSRAIVQNCSGHEIWIALNGGFPQTVESLRASFYGLLSQDRIRVWHPGALSSDWSARTGALLYEAFLTSLSPDVVLITSLFEGFDDNCITSIGAFERQPYPVSVLLHEADIGPSGDHDENPSVKKWRAKKLQDLRRADVYLTTTEPLRELLINQYGLLPSEITNISTNACDANAYAVSSEANVQPFKSSIGDTPGVSGHAIIAALEAAYRRHGARMTCLRSTTGARRRLAYVSPLPPLETGIAEYSAQLIPDICRYYDVDLITSASKTTDLALEGNCQLRSPEWFDRNARHYERIVYHIGNSGFHTYMFDLLERHPGVVVMHDFFLGHVMALPAAEGKEPYSWRRLLRDAHGYQAVAESLNPTTQAQTIWKYHVNLDVLHNATGVIAHSEHARELAGIWYGKDFQEDWRVIPLPRRPPVNANRQAARARLGYSEDDYLVCSFGGIGETKRNLEALSAWAASALANNPNCHLCFVGWKGGSHYMDQISALVAKIPRASIKVIGDVDALTYVDFLSAADCAIQLRTRSRGETSAAVLDCMAYGLPLIVNANGSMKELPREGASVLNDDFTLQELTEKIEELYYKPTLRGALGQAARDHIQRYHSLRGVADLFYDAIEEFSTGRQGLRERLIRAIGSVRQEAKDCIDWLQVAESIAHNHRCRPTLKRLFIDVTEVAKNDLKTGVERVVRNILNELLRTGADDYLIIPLYFDPKAGRWRHASRFVGTAYLSGYQGLNDDIVDICKDDIFLMLDLTYESLIYFPEKFTNMRNDGVHIFFCIYDILPIKLPARFPADAFDVFSTRLNRAASVADGLICISRTVADEVHDYLRDCPLSRVRPLSIGWFHLGSDLMTSPVEMIPVGNHERWLALLTGKRSILMVGTLEPRKGHADAVSAFEKLWDEGSTLQLIICGKEGWMLDDLPTRIRQHPEFGKRLFWFEGASDHTLRKLYQDSSGVLVASEGEGFGLPLVEAASHGKPILARDIPVFREVVGDCATFFCGGAAELAAALKNWLDLIAVGAAPDPTRIKPISWNESADQLLSLIVSKEHPRWNHELGGQQ